MLKEFVIDKFYGGISEDDTLTRDGEIMYSYNVDLTTNSDFINVSPAITNIFTTTSKISTIITVNNTLYFCSDDNKIYDINGVLRYTGSYPVYGFWYTKTKLYFIDSNNNIKYILISNLSQSDWTSYLTTVSTGIASSTLGYCPIVSANDVAFICINNSVYSYNINTDVFPGDFEEFENNIIGITFGGGTYQIFCANGKMILWDGTVGGKLETINLGYDIDGIKQIANITYIFRAGTVYQLNGYTLQPIIKNVSSTGLNANKTDINITNPNGFSLNNFIMYFKSNTNNDIKTSDTTYRYNGNGIASLGANITGLPTALNNIIYNNSITTLHTVAVLGDYIYMTYLDGSTYRVSKSYIKGRDYTTGTNGLILLPKFYGYASEKRLKKNLSRIKILADLGNSLSNKLVLFKLNNGKILEYLGADEASSTMSQITVSEGMQEYEIIVEKNIYNIILGIALKNNTETTITNNVKIYSISYIYEPIEQ